MKTHALKTTILSFVVASALMSPIVAGAKDNGPSVSPPTASAGKSVSGKVSDKSASSLTVDGTKYTVSDSTTFTKGGLPIKLEDVKVGDQVRVTVSDESGSTQATSVEVVSGEK